MIPIWRLARAGRVQPVMLSRHSPSRPLLLGNVLADGVLVQSVLVLGWGMASFMKDLLNELTHGPARLPEGSHVTFFNPTIQPAQFQALLASAEVDEAAVHLLQGDPLDYVQLEQRIDVTKCVQPPPALLSSAAASLNYPWFQG